MYRQLQLSAWNMTCDSRLKIIPQSTYRSDATARVKDTYGMTGNNDVLVAGGLM